MLRNALLQSKTNESLDLAHSAEPTASSIAASFFPLYPATPVEVPMSIPAQKHFAWMAYDLSAAMNEKTEGKKLVMVHEKRRGVNFVSTAELLSHKLNQGVDNTGNIRTWPSEHVLLSYVISNDICSKVQRESTKNLPVACCELGSGMAGLVSLGLLACAPVDFERVAITDGNIFSVENLQLCLEENKMQKAWSPRTKHTVITAELLRWDRNATMRADLLYQFDLVFASDCLFFEEFHEDLAQTIKHLLRRGSGRCLLMQPCRNGSLERFSVIAKRRGFLIHQSRDYDTQILCKHKEYQRMHPDYDPDVHFPVLLTLMLP